MWEATCIVQMVFRTCNAEGTNGTCGLGRCPDHSKISKGPIRRTDSHSVRIHVSSSIAEEGGRGSEINFRSMPRGPLEAANLRTGLRLSSH